jgi:hypothetical protein
MDGTAREVPQLSFLDGFLLGVHGTFNTSFPNINVNVSQVKQFRVLAGIPLPFTITRSLFRRTLISIYSLYPEDSL